MSFQRRLDTAKVSEHQFEAAHRWSHEGLSTLRPITLTSAGTTELFHKERAGAMSLTDHRNEGRQDQYRLGR